MMQRYAWKIYILLLIKKAVALAARLLQTL
jgi:hypothetical protein